MHFFNNLSIKYKIWLAFSVVLLVLALQGVSSLNNLNKMTASFDYIANQSQPAVINAISLEASLQAAATGLSTYLLTRDEFQKQEFDNNLQQSYQLIEQMLAMNVIRESQQSRDMLADVQAKIQQLDQWQKQQLPVFLDDNQNIKAIGFASENINPMSRDILQLISQMITAEDEEEYSSERKSLLVAFFNLRYNWLNLLNEMRLFLAFKSPASIDNMSLYRQGVDEILNKLSAFNEQDILTLDQTDALEQLLAKKQVFYQNLDRLIQIHGSEDWRRDADQVRNFSTPLIHQTRHKIQQLVALQKQAVEEKNRFVKSEAQQQRNNFYLLALLALALVTLVAWYLSRKLTTQLNYAVKITDSIAHGNFHNEIHQDSNDETGLMVRALAQMQEKLHANIQRERKVAAENSRIRQALDTVSASVMVANEENQIIYLNEAAKALFENLETDLARDIPGFSAKEILGSNIDKFHRNPMHQQNLLKTLSSRHEAAFVAGGHDMSFIANPVIRDDGTRLGTVVEWKDMTDEVKTRTEIQSIVDAVKQGDFERRIDPAGKQGFFLTLGEGINEMVSAVSNTLTDINASMSAMAAGDLTQKITHQYLGTFGLVSRNVNDTIDQLGKTVSRISAASVEVSTTAREILDGNSSLSSRTESQAAALEETASSMEEITSTVKQNSDNAQLADQLSDDARITAEKGGEVVSDAIQAMDEINQSSEKIAEIISVIDEIAFQTNLLALNASVEAARAGEQGRGFAVVASEVRNLAGRSATAAKEIKDLIQESVHKVTAGSELVNRSGETLKDIVEGVKKVGDIVGEIAAASKEQSVGIEQVNGAVTSLDETTQQNAALAEETSAASVALTELTTEMTTQLMFFKLDQSIEFTPSAKSASVPASSHAKPSAKSSFSQTGGSTVTPVKAEKNATPAKPASQPKAAAAATESFDEDEWEEF